MRFGDMITLVEKLVDRVDRLERHVADLQDQLDVVNGAAARCHFCQRSARYKRVLPQGVLMVCGRCRLRT